MGIDLSLSNTGIVVWKQKVIAHTLKTTSIKQPLEQRIDSVNRAVRSGIRRYRPELTIIEGHAYNRSNTGTASVHELHGVIKQTLWKSESPFIVCAPVSLKAFAGNYRAGKEEMIQAAIEFWPALRNITGKRDDLADALHLARYGAEKYDSVVEEIVDFQTS